MRVATVAFFEAGLVACGMLHNGVYTQSFTCALATLLRATMCDDATLNHLRVISATNRRATGPNASDAGFVPDRPVSVLQLILAITGMQHQWSDVVSPEPSVLCISDFRLFGQLSFLIRQFGEFAILSRVLVYMYVFQDLSKQLNTLFQMRIQIQVAQ